MSEKNKKNNLYIHDTVLSKDTRTIAGVHDIKNDIARTVSELEEFWDKWDEPIYVSVSAEKKRLWQGKTRIDMNMSQLNIERYFWKLTQSALYNVDKDLKKEELKEMQYITSKFDGNVYRIDFKPEENYLEMEYFLMDVIYKDTYYVQTLRNGKRVLVVHKWIKFPIPIREFSFLAEQAKKQVVRQWKTIVRNLKIGMEGYGH